MLWRMNRKRLEFEALRDSGKVVTFLNTDDSTLGGRPIDLAVASAEGLASVDRAIAALH